MAVNLKYWRIYLLIYNVLLAVLCFAALFLKFYFLYYVLQYRAFIEDESVIYISIIICNGVFTILFTRIGWKVVNKSSVVQVILFGVLMLMFTVCSIVCFAGLLRLLHRLKDETTIRTDETFKLAVEENSPVYIKLWERIQSQLMCCGVGGPSDYRASLSVPWSCCKRSIVGEVSDNFGDCSAVYQKGCLLRIYDKSFDYLLDFAFISLAMALFQLLGSVSYFYMAKLMRKKAAAEIQLPPTESQQETRRGLLPRPQKY